MSSDDISTSSDSSSTSSDASDSVKEVSEALRASTGAAPVASRTVFLTGTDFMNWVKVWEDIWAGLPKKVNAQGQEVALNLDAMSPEQEATVKKMAEEAPKRTQMCMAHQQTLRKELASAATTSTTFDV